MAKILGNVVVAAQLTISAGYAQAPTRGPIQPVASAEQCPAGQSPILILGTYHMANPGLDSVNLEADDVLSQRRQREIEELTQRLARFRPTKVMIEAPYANPTQQRRYEEYLAGQYMLTRNEIDQIAFRLAKQVGLSSITPIDFPMMMSGLTYDELEFQPQPQTVAAALPARQLTDDERRLRSSTVAEFLLHINDEARWRLSHLGYMRNFEPRPDNPAIYEAPDRLVNWYKRNFRMWSNVVRKTERPKDRVLLLVGSGHLAILRGLAQDMPGFCLVEPKAYLE